MKTITEVLNYAVAISEQRSFYYDLKESKKSSSKKGIK